MNHFEYCQISGCFSPLHIQWQASLTRVFNDKRNYRDMLSMLYTRAFFQENMAMQNSSFNEFWINLRMKYFEVNRNFCSFLLKSSWFHGSFHKDYFHSWCLSAILLPLEKREKKNFLPANFANIVIFASWLWTKNIYRKINRFECSFLVCYILFDVLY